MTNKNNVDFEYHYHLSSPNPLPLESHLPAPSRVVWEASPRKSRSSNTQTHQLELDQDLATPLSAGWSFQASSERVHMGLHSVSLASGLNPARNARNQEMTHLLRKVVEMLLLIRGCCWTRCWWTCCWWCRWWGAVEKCVLLCSIALREVGEEKWKLTTEWRKEKQWN